MSVSNEKILEELIAGHNLDSEMVCVLMDGILSGQMPPVQIAAALALLRAKGESAKEIAQASLAVREVAQTIEKPCADVCDIVGTGGDGQNTINVSTIASIVAASCGATVAKHGNVSVSSRCGSADVLKELGLDLSISTPKLLDNLRKNRWCFLYAPNFHPAFKSVKPIRQELKIKTLFNVLGPLVNPICPDYFVIGVYDEKLVNLFAHALKDLSCKKALVVHGSGLDEICLHGTTSAALLDHGSIEKLKLEPEDLGFDRISIEQIRGADPSENARQFEAILKGDSEMAKINMIAASAGALLWVCGLAKNLKEGCLKAQEEMLSKRAFATFEKIKEHHNGA